MSGGSRLQSRSAAQHPAGHPRHDARGPDWCVRLPRRADTGARSSGDRRRRVRACGLGCADYPARTRQPAHRTVSVQTRRPKQWQFRPRSKCSDAGDRAARQRISHRRLCTFVLDRRYGRRAGSITTTIDSAEWRKIPVPRWTRLAANDARPGVLRLVQFMIHDPHDHPRCSGTPAGRPYTERSYAIRSSGRSSRA